MFGWMSTPGKREWHVLRGGDETHTAVREKTDPEELSVIIKRMKGKYLKAHQGAF